MVYKYSIKHLLFILCLLLIVFRFLVDPINMLTWDVFGYYLYLPAYFTYSDLGLVNQEWLTNLIDTYKVTATLYQADNLETGKWVIKYTMGLSILYAPFFLIAQILAETFGYSPDGFSLPYQYTITIGGLIYAMIGLVYLSKILGYFFNKYISSIVLVIIFFGTNYFQLTIYEGTLLSHNFLFTFYAILTYYTIKWYHNRKIKYATCYFLLASIQIPIIIKFNYPVSYIAFIVPFIFGILTLIYISKD